MIAEILEYKIPIDAISIHVKEKYRILYENLTSGESPLVEDDKIFQENLHEVFKGGVLPPLEKNRKRSIFVN